MASRSAPPAQDIARLVASTYSTEDSNAKATAENLLEFWKRPPVWGYGPFVDASHDIVSKCRSEDEAAATCANRGHKKGRDHNVDVARCLYRKYGGGKFRAVPLSTKRLQLRPAPRLMTTIRPGPLILRESGPTILVPQPRKSFVLTPRQWSFYSWIVRRAFARGEVAGFPIEFIDFSVDDDGARTAKVCHQSGLPTFESKEARDLLTIFFSGFDMAVKIAPADQKRRRTPAGEELPLFPGI